METYDVLIVGGGITGCLTAWNSVRQGYRTALVERACDVATGATRANSGILHSGIHEAPDTRMFQLCRDGLLWYRKWAEKLDFPLQPSSTVILADSFESRERLVQMAAEHANTLAPALLSKNEVRSRWPFLGQSFVAALEVKDSAKISPYDACRAIFENAVGNGLKYHINSVVSGAERKNGMWQITINLKKVRSRFVIIAAGQGSNEAGQCFGLFPTPQKLINGAYFLMSRKAGPEFSEVFFSPGNHNTKGILIQKTVHGNLMLGPDAIDRADLTGPAADWERLCRLWEKVSEMISGLERQNILRTFSGDRVYAGSEFIIEDHLNETGVLRLDGIRSPGLTAAPALAVDIIRKLHAHLKPVPVACNDFRPSIESSQKGQPGGHLVCRCEKVYLAAVKDAIRRGARCIETLRWQTRSGMGDCQGSFCRPEMIHILQKELGLVTDEIYLRDQYSKIFSGDLK